VYLEAATFGMTATVTNRITDKKAEKATSITVFLGLQKENVRTKGC